MRIRPHDRVYRFPDVRHTWFLSRGSASENWKYKRRQNMAFMEMTAEWVRLMQSRLKDDESWYDPFGDLYMALSSRTGQRMQGQFFTPPPSVS